MKRNKRKQLTRRRKPTLTINIRYTQDVQFTCNSIYIKLYKAIISQNLVHPIFSNGTFLKWAFSSSTSVYPRSSGKWRRTHKKKKLM